MPATPTPPPTQAAALRDLHRVLLLVNSGGRLDDVLRAAAEGVRDVLGFGGVAVNLLSACGFFETVVAVGPGAEAVSGSRHRVEDVEAELETADRWGLLRFVPAGRYVLPDDAVVWRTDEPAIDEPDAWQPDDALYAPLCGADGHLLGVLGLDLPADGRRPGPEARAILEIYAVQIGLAVGQARERERLEERVRLSAAVRRLVSTASDSLELAEVLPACVPPLLEGFRAEKAWIRLFADDGGAWEAVNYPADLGRTMHHSAAEDQGWPALDEARAFASAWRVAGACWADRRTVVIDEHRTEGDDVVPATSRRRIVDWLRALGHAQFVMVPLGSARQCLGYVVLTRTGEAGAWTEAEEDAALDVARELGRVIGTARVRLREHEVLQRLERLDAHRTEVITTVVHELKNPLAAILGNLEMVRDDPAVTARAHQAIQASGERMLRLVQDMLTLARLRDPATVEHVPVDLTGVVLTVADQLVAQAERAGVDLDLSGALPGVRVLGDGEELEQLVLNLASNAIKFSDAGDSVRLQLVRESGPQGRAVLRVVDEGIGISPEDQEGLFTEFDRGTDPEARRRPGSGLGLAIAGRVAERHGGRIEVGSHPGRGSTFTVRLPPAG
ncbi:sensor histidine kinase [Nocardioides sp. AX2bis]|uniref:sensor histidine kinase n=1 Tax=Nocardioides sp. AX2bis TaxID=2653157 RepID=UPI0012EFA7FA|nr:GAF domain-containing sensor histidine kinase [Nocardioides sp. AX2bis]VXA92043.1 putative Histidine kinase [Nocardioides sp. AX2bis]